MLKQSTENQVLEQEKQEQQVDLAPEALSLQESKLLQDLEDYRKTCPRDDYQLLINRLFEHSVSDALKYSNVCAMTRSEIKHAVSEPLFYLKHEALVAELRDQLKRNKKYTDSKDGSADAEELIDKYSQYQKDMRSGSFVSEHLNSNRRAPWSTQDKINDIDDYYLNFYKLEKVDLRSSKDVASKSRLEELTMRSLQRSKLALEDNYYSGGIISVLFKKLIVDNFEEIEAVAKKNFNNNEALKEKYGNDFPRYFKALERGSVPSSEIVLKFLRSYQDGAAIANTLANSDLINSEQLALMKELFDLDDTIDEKRIKQAQYKPLNLNYEAGKELAVKELRHSLNLSLKMHLGIDAEVVLDKESNKYIVPGYADATNEKDDNEQEVTQESKTTRIIDEAAFDSMGIVNGLPYFKVQKGSRQFIIGPDGKRISNEYDWVSSPQDINGSPYFRAKQGGKHFIIGPDGKRISNEYDDVEDLMEINGSPYFKAKQGGRFFIIGPDGRIGDEYDWVSSPQDINGEPYFMILQRDRYFIIRADGERIGDEYDDVWSPRDVGGSHYFKALQGDNYFFIGPEGKRIGDKYDDVEGLMEINGLPYFEAWQGDKQFIVGPDGKRIGAEYDGVDGLTEINGLPYFKAQQGGKEFIIGPDGQRIGDEYDEVEDLTSINNSPYFKAQHSGKQFIIGPDGKRIGDEYNTIFDLMEINGRPSYTAQRGDKWLVIGPDGKRVGDEYEDMGGLKQINDAPYFKAKQAGKYFIIGPDGKKLGDEYTAIKSWYYNEKTEQLVIIGAREGAIYTQEIAIVSEQAKDELSAAEKEQLRVLNLVHSPKLEDINKYLESHQTIEKKQLNKGQLLSLSNTINNNPDLLLEFNAAKKDRLVSQTATRLLYKIYPEILENRSKEEARQAQWNNSLGLSSFWGQMGFDASASGNKEKNGVDGARNNQSNLQNQSSANTYEGGGFGEGGKEAQKVFELRESIKAMMVNNIFSKYNNSWSKLEFSLTRDVDTPFREITNTLVNVGNSFNVSLPRPVEGRIIPERVKGIKVDGSEVKLGLQINSLQEVVCISQENVKEIVYSFKMPEVAAPLADISEEASREFISKLPHSKELTENIADLPEDIILFIHSLKTLSPKERIMEIENFIRTNSYYDFKNEETISLKRNKVITEIIDIMELRAQELAERGENKECKKYAGVCADFALLTTSLLRQANFASGYLTGYNVSGTQATTNSAHASSYVLWPDGKGKTRMINIDGTPSGAESGQSRLEEVSSPSIKEREEMYQKIKAEKQAEVLKAIAEIEKINFYSEDALSVLNNGQLEDILNNILQYSITQENLEAIEASLRAYWYSPLSKLDLADIDNSLQATRFLESEIKRARARSSESNGNSAEAGSLLFASLEDFLDKFKRSEKKESAASGLKVLEKVYELSKSNLTDIERKALLVTLRYLEAKKIKGDRA